MLVNLTPKIKEIARRISVAKEENFNYLPQSEQLVKDYFMLND